LFAAAVVCALLALSFSGGKEVSAAQFDAPVQVAALATSTDTLLVDSKAADSLTLAEYRDLKKRVLKPGGGGGGGNPASSFKAVPGGPQEFDACCDSCGANGCTGCNSGPNGLNCGSGLIAADCQVVNDEVTCVKKDD
jgi:hypothetical protein